MFGNRKTKPVRRAIVIDSHEISSNRAQEYSEMHFPSLRSRLTSPKTYANRRKRNFAGGSAKNKEKRAGVRRAV